MVGKPKHKVGDLVHFFTTINGQEYHLGGEVYIVDKYGIFTDNSDVYYDIMVETPVLCDDPCLFKHIREDMLID